MRVIGFDLQGRPIMYSNFTHAHDRFNAESCVTHLIDVLEDASRYMDLMNRGLVKAGVLHCAISSFNGVLNKSVKRK